MGLGEALEQGGLVVGDGPILARVQVASLLRLEELGADCHGRTIPVEAPHDVHGSGRVFEPAGRLEVVRKIGSVAALGDLLEALHRCIAVVSTPVELPDAEGTRHLTVPDPCADLVKAFVHVGLERDAQQRLANGPVREQAVGFLRPVRHLGKAWRL